MTGLIKRDVAHVLIDLPEYCVVGPTEASKLAIDVGYAIHRGVPGYTPLPSLTDESAAEINAGITPAQIEAMQNGSMFGWHVPGADPLNCGGDHG
jgi:hypothetical protein